MLRNVSGHIWAELVSPELMVEQVFNINYNVGGKLEGPYLVNARVNTLCCCIHESQSSWSIVVQIKHQHQRNPRGKEPRKALPPTHYIPLALHPSDQLLPAGPTAAATTSSTVTHGSQDGRHSATASCSGTSCPSGWSYRHCNTQGCPPGGD